MTAMTTPDPIVPHRPDPSRMSIDQLTPRLFVLALFGGGLRWLATAAAAAGVLLIVLITLGVVDPAVPILLHLEGRPAWWTIAGATAFWLVNAAINWLMWMRRRR